MNPGPISMTVCSPPCWTSLLGRRTPSSWPRSVATEGGPPSRNRPGVVGGDPPRPAPCRPRSASRSSTTAPAGQLGVPPPNARAGRRRRRWTVHVALGPVEVLELVPDGVGRLRGATGAWRAPCRSSAPTWPSCRLAAAWTGSRWRRRPGVGSVVRCACWPRLAGCAAGSTLGALATYSRRAPRPGRAPASDAPAVAGRASAPVSPASRVSLATATAPSRPPSPSRLCVSCRAAAEEGSVRSPLGDLRWGAGLPRRDGDGARAGGCCPATSSARTPSSRAGKRCGARPLPNGRAGDSTKGGAPATSWASRCT